MAIAWTDADRAELSRRGIPIEEAERQIDTLRHPPRSIELVRPATRGDGIVVVPEREIPELHRIHAEAASSGRIVKFVPASGAASRMFQSLLHFERGEGRGLEWEAIRARAESGDAHAAALVRFLSEIERHPFREALIAPLRGMERTLSVLAASDDFRSVLRSLLGKDGLDFDSCPKGLLPFHAYANEVRTPFEEHLVEAAEYARSASGAAALHFTVSPEHRDAFERLLARVRERFEARHGCRYEVSFSSQQESTDTLAIDSGGLPFRDAEGKLRFRPGGHGSLLTNLAALGADLVVLKNIDNVQTDDRRTATVAWKKTLVGWLVRLEERAFRHLRALESPSITPQELSHAEEFSRTELMAPADDEPGGSIEARRARARDRLDRPLRVCGMVPNTGEPGGGPFWARGRDGAVGLQIVESAEVDRGDVRQREILSSATHFNPVDLVCSVRDVRGRPFDLERFVDHDAGIVARKSEGGRDLVALERPGLWNGAMARWNTVFVEVPLETFSPVKTVLDLLREEHQPAR